MLLNRRNFLNFSGMFMANLMISACTGTKPETNFSSTEVINLTEPAIPPRQLSSQHNYLIGCYNISNNDIQENYINPLIYSTLIDMDISTGDLFSDIASKIEILNPTNYLFSIRDDIYFHPDQNGYAERMTIEDIIIDFQIRKENSEAFFSKVIKDIKVINSKILLVLHQPFPYFFEYIANPSLTGIGKPASSNFNQQRRGSGPFLPLMINSDEFILGRNELYHQKELPLLKTIVIKNYPDINILRNDFNENKIDLIYSDEFIESLNSIPLNYTELVFPSKELIYLGLSMDNYKGGKQVKFIKAFQNPKVRKALSMALDRKKLSEEFNGFLSGPIPPSFPLDSLNVNELGLNEFMRFDPDTAAVLLEESGYKGLEFRIDLPNSIFFNQLGGELIRQISNVGFKPRLIFRDINKLQKSFQLGDFECILFNYNYNLNPDDGLLINTSSGKNGQFSYWGFSSPIYDLEVEKSFLNNLPTQRGSLAKNAQQILFEQSPAMIPLFCKGSKILASQKISGFQYNKFESNMKLYSKYWSKYS